MITEIKLKNVASYKEETKLTTNKPINLIYGLNGTGKTTLSNYLKNPSEHKFSNCTISGGTTSKILVYNQEFINENFYEKDDLKGIFTLSEINATAETNIETAKKEKEKLNTQHTLKNDILNKINGDNGTKKQKFKNVIDVIWEIKTTFSGGDRILDYCLEGVKGSKETLFNHLNSIKKPDKKPVKTTDELKNEISKIEGDEAIEITLLQKLELLNISDIETNQVFDEVIVGNQDSSISGLIEKLQNSDWVKQGIVFLPETIIEPEYCPFCQQKTISQNLLDEIKNYFDKTYDDKIESLNDLRIKYEDTKNKLPEINMLLTNEFTIAKKENLENLYTKLINILSENIKLIDKKIKLPSSKVELKSSNLALNEINNFIVDINKQITEYNEKIKNKKTVKETIKKEFWDIMRWDYDIHLSNYESDLKKLLKEEKDIKDNIKLIKDNIQLQDNIIKDNQNSTINVEKAIDAINYQLALLGLHSFEIIKHSDEFYRIVREGENQPEFKSLSEGEKMIISFLYFLELCKGKESKEESLTEKIVIIDDPISSLSHNYVFNIAQLIKREFFLGKNYLQIFVLTHNIYFFHELCKLTEYKPEKEKRKLFRIVKNAQKSSSIIEMSNDEILNDYQAYWKIIKDHEIGKSHDSILANSMRNILEHFFGFIDNEKMQDAIKKLDDIKYGAFLRYINRESHSDQTNISDIKEIDVQLFKDAFKRIFEDSGNLNHYEKMLNN